MEIKKEYEKFFDRKKNDLCVHDAKDVIAFAKHCQELQSKQAGVVGGFSLDSELQMMLGDLIYQEEKCYDWFEKKKIKNKIKAVSVLLEIETF